MNLAEILHPDNLVLASGALLAIVVAPTIVAAAIRQANACAEQSQAFDKLKAQVERASARADGWGPSANTTQPR